MEGDLLVGEPATSLTLENVTLDKNTAYGRGGGVFLTETTADFKNVTIDDNVVASTLRSGGGIWAGNDTDIDWTGGSLSNNIATEDGGGLATGSIWSDSEAAGHVKMTDVDIKGNTANRMGGGFMTYRSNTTLEITSTDGSHEISNNVSERGRDQNFDEGGGGGAIWGGKVNISDYDIKSNTAVSQATGNEPRRGGGLMIRSNAADVTLNNVDIDSNDGGRRCRYLELRGCADLQWW